MRSVLGPVVLGERVESGWKRLKQVNGQNGCVMKCANESSVVTLRSNLVKLERAQ